MGVACSLWQAVIDLQLYWIGWYSSVIQLYHVMFEVWARGSHITCASVNYVSRESLGLMQLRNQQTIRTASLDNVLNQTTGQAA